MRRLLSSIQQTGNLLVQAEAFRPWLHAHILTGLQVVIPAKLEEQLKAGMQEAGIPVPDTPERWGQAMTALKVFLTMFQLVETPCAS